MKPNVRPCTVEKIVIMLSLFAFASTLLAIKIPSTVIKEAPLSTMNTINSCPTTTPFVQKTVLSNGMTILVRPVHTLPKVSIQLWYGVGSRDESDKERGIAHLIEHMIFKGTQKISESDINVVTHALSGSCNAFTSYDYTGYLFNFPTQNWKEALPIMADCMVNCSFDNEMLSSEMKAVIQELKMGRDNYVRTIVQSIISTIFDDHPYHHPVIGYKQDLWNVTNEDLRNFYKKHYLPNNATLVVVGDVKIDEVVALAESCFGTIAQNADYKRPVAYFTQDIAAKSVSIYRDVKQPVAIFTFVTPGTRDKQDYALQSIAWILGKGKSSRLYRRLVEELGIATSVDASYDDLFDHGLLFIICEPKQQEDLPIIKKEIELALLAISQGRATDLEVTKAIKQTQMNLFDLLEDIENQANEIGKYYLATNDENFAFTFVNQPKEELKAAIQHLSAAYLRPTVMHEGLILPLPASEIPVWQELQSTADQEDARILAARIRTTPIEPARYACTIKPNPATPFAFPKATTWQLENGLKVFTYRNTNTPKIEIVLDLKVDENYDSQEKPGLCRFMSRMLNEGTKNYSSQELAQALESRGISLGMQLGGLSMSLLREDLPFALEIINQIVTQATFDEKQIEKVREQLLTQIKNFWDDPRSCSSQLIKEAIYQKHPYAKNSLGTAESINAITKKDLIDYYQKFVSPFEARLAIVGDIDPEQTRALIEQNFGSWHGPHIADIIYPALEQTKEQRINHYLNRDQVSLGLARLSVERTHKDFDKLLLFDQILSGGALGSMHSRLFQLREQSGLFYTISGSLIAGAYEQPGMFLVRTIVSMDRLAEAEKAIRETLQTCVDSITAEELDEAKRAIESTIIDNFASNYSMALAFLFLDRYKFAADFFDNRVANLEKITLPEVQQAVRKVLIADQLLVLNVGRVK